MNVEPTSKEKGNREHAEHAASILRDKIVRTLRQLDQRLDNLDLRSEAKIEHALDTILEGRSAVIIAHQLGAAQTRLDILAFVYIVLRVIYIVMYVADLATVRSVVWTLALLVNIGILFVGYR